MNVAIIKYNSGNVRSVQNAFMRIGADVVITDDALTIKSADRVVFPGVGHAATAMSYIRAHKLDEVILNLQQPVLGICLGMQLMCAYSEEGNTTGLGIFDTNVKKFRSSSLKVPQVGWNNIDNYGSELFTGLKPAAYMYFVHSFYAELSPQTVAKTEYILSYSAALQQRNFYAVQFHPEKSGEAGEQLLRNFLERT